MSTNDVRLDGNLGQPVELNFTQTGKAVARMRVATSSVTNGKTFTEWHTVVAWEKLGESCKAKLEKGSRVSVVGRLQTRKYTDDDGVVRYPTEIVAHRVMQDL